MDVFSGFDIYKALEFLAMGVGFVYVLLEVKKSHYLWYFCIASAVLNLVVFYHNSYLSMALLQFYYIGNSIYGIKQFLKMRDEAIAIYGPGPENRGKKLAISHFNWKVGIAAAVIAVVIFLVLAPIMKSYAEANGTAAFPSQPYWDAFIAVGSMLATFYLSKSYMCQWYLWLVINVISTVIFAMSGMYWMSLMYFSYIVISSFGLRNWIRNGVYIEIE